MGKFLLTILLPKYIDIFIVVTLAGQMWAEWV
jgi:hypothetical protein